MRSSFLRWAVFAPLLAIMAACGGGGGGGGGGGPVDPRDRPDDGIAAMQITPNPVKLGEKVQIIVNVDCSFTMGPNLELVRPNGTVVNVMLFGDIEAPYISFYEFTPDMAGEWEAQYDGWTACGDPHVWLHFWVTDGPPPPPPPPPPSDCEVGLGVGGDGSCTLGVRFHFTAVSDGRSLDLMGSAADRALVKEGWLEFVQYQNVAYDVLQTNPNNGFCLDCYRTDQQLRWVRARGTIWCDGKWKEITGAWEPISDYIPGWPSP